MIEWDSRVLAPGDLCPALQIGEQLDFKRLVDRLFAQQVESWPDLRAGVGALQQVEYRRLSVAGAPVLLQHNPRRIVSTGAQVDSASIMRRPCFLCPGQMPEEEKGLAFGTQFVVVCNPYPVLNKHLVLVSREHRLQLLDGNVTHLLNFAEALGPDFVVLYNGPSSGASAPDHLHLQAGEAQMIPVLRDVEVWEKFMIPSPAGIETFALTDYRVNAIILRGGDRLQLENGIQRILHVLGDIVITKLLEPMINLLVTKLSEVWQVVIFPRERHRPACFYSTGDDRLTVSPAAIDMGGLIVVPEGRDFERMDAEIVERIYAEVTLADEKFERLIEVLGRIVLKDAT